MDGAQTPGGRFWKILAAREGDVHNEHRERLRSGLQAMRRHAGQLAGRIEHDLPEFTVHDITHLDALWLLADRIAGPEIELTPTEAFLFGAAVLVHDLGLAVAAYPEGPEALHREPAWRDALGQELRARLGRAASLREIEEADADVRRAAERRLLRTDHAAQAARLALVWWEPRPDERLYLLPDDELRTAFGELIGQVAASHWWSVERLAEELPWSLGAPGGWPSEWSIRPAMIACLLRCADAAHLDAERAPDWARVGRELEPVARAHWDFQRRLAQPRVVGDRLQFDALTAFPRDEAEAWWTCLDALRVVDRELRAVDALLGDGGEARFAARSVVGVEAPRRLSQHVPVQGWTPVDARLEISDIASLVDRLGGKQLYGDVPFVPLRELIQNATDAVRARRALGGGGTGVTLRHSPADEPLWLEIEDDGVGMPSDLLAGALLDFGRSGWDGPELSKRYPGLIGSGFQPTGRFGIGFFSAFMWADRVEVVSRPFRAGAADTSVLEIPAGLSSRPLLRPADPEEQLDDGGTRVRLWLREPVRFAVPSSEIRDAATDDMFPDAYLVEKEGLPAQLTAVCEYLCPALPVDLHVEVEGHAWQVIAGDDWTTLDAETLLRRTRWVPAGTRYLDELPKLAARLQPISAGTTVIARGVLIGGGWPSELSGILVHGGLRVTTLHSMIGIWVAVDPNAARSQGHLAATREQMAAWAVDQSRLLIESGLGPGGQLEIARRLTALGCEPGELKIAWTPSGWVSEWELEAWAAERVEILVVSAYSGASWPPTLHGKDHEEIPLTYEPNVLCMNLDPYADAFHDGSPASADMDRSSFRSVDDRIEDTIARAWDLEGREQLRFERGERPVATTADGRPHVVWARRLTRQLTAPARSAPAP